MTETAKVVLVTGASAGIGLASADRLHRAGWTVVGASRRGTTVSDRTPATAAGHTPGTATSDRIPATATSDRAPATGDGHTPGTATSDRTPATGDGHTPGTATSDRAPATAVGHTPGTATSDRTPATGDGHAPGTATSDSTATSAAGHWSGLVMDVDDDDSVRDGVGAVIAAHGRIDAVVAAAGWGVAGPVELTAIDEAKAQLETNFWGCVRVVHAVLPAMRAQRGGRIVLISSIGGVLGIPFQAFYSASKFALEGYGEALGYEVAPFGIEVTLVQPGNVRTDFTANRKMAAAAAGDGIYAAALGKAVGLMERDEINGAPAGDVAAAVQRVLAAGRPPRRVSVGKAGERFGILAKRILPFRVFEAVAKSGLGVS